MQINSKLKKFFAVAALVFFGGVTASINFTDDKTEVHVEKYKVRAGDTLWDVARYYRDLDSRNLYIFEYIDEMRENNAWLIERKNQIYPNDLLEVKYYVDK